jgi:hypothetical protein
MKRRWFQFSLRTLLILAVVLSFTLSYWRVKWEAGRPAREEAAARAELTRLGVLVEIGKYGRAMPGRVTFIRLPVTDDALKLVERIPDLRTVVVADCPNITLAALREMKATMPDVRLISDTLYKAEYLEEVARRISEADVQRAKRGKPPLPLPALYEEAPAAGNNQRLHDGSISLCSS